MIVTSGIQLCGKVCMTTGRSLVWYGLSIYLSSYSSALLGLLSSSARAQGKVSTAHDLYHMAISLWQTLSQAFGHLTRFFF